MFANKTIPPQQDDEALFQSLKKKPAVAWPTVIMALVCIATFYYVIYLGITDQISLWLGCLINCVAGYYLFSPAHDSLHRAVFYNNRLNDVFGIFVVNALTPYASMHLFRLMHMRHHRFANEPELDPDHFSSKLGWGLVSSWFFWDMLYGVRYIKELKQRSGKEIITILGNMLAGASVLVVLFYYFPIEMLVLWFIPNRVTLWLICYVFMYLTHVPHDVYHRDAPYQATLIRRGWEWLLDPLMAYQNWHLVHHLYPTIPFYRMKKAWFARYHQHMSQQPAVIPAFQLKPNNSQADAPESQAAEFS